MAPVERILGGPGGLRIVLPPPRCNPGCSGADPGIIPGENVPEDPDSSRCPPGVSPWAHRGRPHRQTTRQIYALNNKLDNLIIYGINEIT